MSSKAQIRASRKYNDNNTKGYYIRFNKKSDADIISKLSQVQNKTSYIRSLILADIFKKHVDI